jgi:muramidase (phage lysozyme)
MARKRDPKILRKSYEVKLGKKLADQLTDEQIGLISKYYNSLSDKESSELDSQLVQGRNNTELHAMAESMASERKDKIISNNKIVTTKKSEKVSVYKPEDKNVDDFIEKTEQKTKEALEETSDAIMDAIDELIAADKKRFEDFKKKTEQEAKGKFQYENPIGPDAMQGPKEPPEKKEPAKKTESQVENPWEDEVQDQLGNKIDDVLDQIRKEPLPQPTPSKRRKTRGKKKFDRKVLSSESMGLSEQLSEIKINVMETREALYNMYKIDKARFEFKKSIDKKLTTRLAARKREKELEQIKPDPGDSNTSAVGEGEKEESALGGLLDFLLGPFKKAGIAGLSAALSALALPLILDAVEDYLTKDTKGPRNQIWDPLGIIPDPGEGEEDDPVTKFFNWFIPKAEDSAEPSVRDGSRTPESEAEAFSSFWGDIFRSREESNEPSVRDGSRTPQTGFDYVPSQDSKGKKYDKAPLSISVRRSREESNEPSIRDGSRTPQTGFDYEPSIRDGSRTPQTGFDYVPSPDSKGKKYGETPLSIPVRRAFDGGKFTRGVKKPLKPITDIPPVGSGVQKLTKPLRSSITVPQKVATLGILNLANSILQPFTSILPEDANSEIKSLFTGITSKSGLGNFNLKTKSKNIFDKIKSFIDNILNSLLGGSAQASPQTPVVSGAGGGEYYGPAFGPSPLNSNLSTSTGVGTKEQRALLDAIAFSEGTTKSYGTIFGGQVIPELEKGELTIDEVHAMMMSGQVKGRSAGYSPGSFATGRYQFMPDTLRDIQRSMKLSGDTLFTNEMQDKMFLDRTASYRKVTPELLAKEGLSTNVLDRMAPEIASFPSSAHGGASYYGQPVKSASKLREVYDQSLRTPTPEPPKVSGLTPTSEDMSWYNDKMKPSTPIDKTPPEPDPKRQFNPMETIKNLIGGTPTVASPTQKVNKPRTTTPIGSDPMLQPGGY